MAVPLSVDDAFTVGVSFDLLGGYLLGRGLLASPSEIASRTLRPTTWGHGFNAPEAVTHIRSRADAQAGLISLGIGFSLQWSGYIAIIAGATVDTGLGRAVLSLALSVLAAVGAYLLFRRLRWKLVKRLAVRIARADPLTGTMDAAPDAQTLLALGRALGIAYVEVTEQGVTPIEPWAREHFGVAVIHRYPPDMPAPHGR
jgi:hypothetical protein